ncbi:Nucleolar pre-ribosomal-associated protein [Gracilaria domingensis]|nr:Nucleolar pre-ribosomal-associated protein [Gracilaria domingensis]
MAYVDDLKLTFDAAQFCEQITAAIGHGRASSEAALKKDPSALATASTALHKFLALAKSEQPPDVIAAYVSYSPRAAEIFNSLRTVTVDPSVASVAIECLIEIVRYSLKPENPPHALEHVRSVVRSIVRTQVPLMIDVLVKDKRACARKALELLRLTAMCHPLLAKELLNKYLFSAKRLASILCSKGNNYCRMPFLDLLFSIITCSKRDVHFALSFNARDILISCLSTITQRTAEEANKTSPAREQPSSKTNTAAQKAKPALPGYVQKRELIASINYLLALHKHLFEAMPKHVRRKTFASPMCVMLAKIASTELPSLSVAPAQVQDDQKALRHTAGRLFNAFARDVDGFLLKQAADSLLATGLVKGSSVATSFGVQAIEEQPRLSNLLLENGPFLCLDPQPSTKWLSFCSILSASLMRINTIPPILRKQTFLEKCLSHKSSIVRHFGHLFTLSCCRIVQENDQYLENPEMHLPSVDFIKQNLRNETSGDALVHKLLAEYQLIFARKVDKRKTILMNAAVVKSGGNVLEAENSIRAGLRVAPKETVMMVVNHKLFSRLVLQASASNDQRLSHRLWHLCRDVLCHSFLFPQGTKYEVEVFLSVISGLGKECEVCVNALENMICTALANPYGLYDQLNLIVSLSECTSPPISLFFVATLIRIRKLKEAKKPMQGMSESEQKIFETSLIRFVGFSLASLTVLGSNTERNCSLMNSVSRFVSTDLFWWSSNSVVKDIRNEEQVIKACLYIRELLPNLGTYPRTPLFALLSSLCSCFLNSSPNHDEDIRTFSELRALELSWDSWRDFGSEALGSYHNSDLLRTDLETSALPHFFLQLCCAKGISGQTFEEQLRSLRQSLVKKDFVVLLSALFRTTSSTQFRDMLLPALIFELTQDDGKHQESKEVIFCLGAAIITSIRNGEQWDQESVREIIASCIRILEACGNDSSSKQRMAFCTAVLYNLSKHRCPSVSVFSYLLLNNIKHLKATFLPSLSIHCSAQLAGLLPHFPALSGALIEHVLTWADGAGRPLSFPLLVLLQRFLERKSSLPQSGIDDLKWRSSLLHIAKALDCVEQSENFREGDPNYQIVARAVRKLGEHVILDISSAKELLEALKENWVSSRNFPKFMWILWYNILVTEQCIKWESVAANQTITELFGLFVESIATTPERLVELSVLQLLNCILSFVGARKHLSSVGVSNSSVTEGKLLDVARNLIHFAVKYRNGLFFGIPFHDTERLSFDHYELICSCVSEILGLDALVDEVAKESITLLCKEKESFASLVGASLDNDFPPSFEQTGNEQQVINSPSHAQLYSTANLLRAALNRMDKTNLSEEIMDSLLNIEEVLSCFSVYNASTNVGDGLIRDIMDRITAIRLLSSRSELSLQVRRGYWQSNASNLLPSFDKRLLEDACDRLLSPEAEAKGLREHVKATGGTRTFLDAKFVLQLLLRGCGEALERPSQPVLDINYVVREGLLGLALTGLAAHEQATRSLAYASLELFSRLLGSGQMKTQGAAAALYKDRKQLVFFLELLRNSITEPLIRCLPLFIVWFRITLGVALNPRHPANKIVTTFFLRSPTVDVNDCLGLYHLLNCGTAGDELLPTRSLALEILAKGVRTRKDVLVLRKRRMINTIFMFAMRKSLFNSSLSFAAFRTLSALVERDRDLDLALELVSRYGLVSWLVQDSLEGPERERQLMTKLDILSKLAKKLQGCRDAEKHMKMLSMALNDLGRTVLQWNSLPGALLNSLLKCGLDVSGMMPELRHSIQFDFSEIYDNKWLRDQDDAELRVQTANMSKCIVRQMPVSVSQETRIMLLRQTIFLFTDAIDEASDNELSERAMYHTFIAECFLDECVHQQNPAIDSDCLELLAQVLYTQPSIWIILAAYAALDACKSISASLLPLANVIPSVPPGAINHSIEGKHDSIVQDRHLIQTLCSSLLSVSRGQIKNGEAYCEPKSASLSE